MWRSRVIRDPIHGFIEYGPEEDRIIQSPFLRRLHGVKQLGLSNLVFPGATHTRFSHSIGTMYVSGLIADKLLSKMTDNCSEFFIDCRDGPLSFLRVARLVGLLHDIGHTPYSHQMEDSLRILVDLALWAGAADRGRVKDNILDEIKNIYSKIDTNLRKLKIHEIFTQAYISRLAETLPIDSNLRLSLDLVTAILSGNINGKGEEVGEKLGMKWQSIRILKDIISHDIVDADRIDYLERDGEMTGVVYGKIDMARLLQGIKVDINIPGIIITARSLSSLEDIFDARYKMYKNVYFHHKVKSINIALNRSIESIFNEWDNIAPPYLRKIVETPSLFLDAEFIAEKIYEGSLFFTDNEIFTLLTIASREGSQVASRWARSLLHRRDLLPVSLVKRPDELLADIVEEEGSHFITLNDAKRMNEILKSESFRHSIHDKILHFSREWLSGSGVIVDSDDIKVDLEPMSIFDKNKIKKYIKIYKSLYLEALADVSSIELSLVYVYSDNIKIHKELFRYRSFLRKLFTDILKKEWKKLQKE